MFLDDTSLLTLSSICDAEFQVALLPYVVSLPSLFGPPHRRTHHSATFQVRALTGITATSSSGFEYENYTLSKNGKLNDVQC
jgi:hypothetical protein